jgi:hypothetical protein
LLSSINTIFLLMGFNCRHNDNEVWLSLKTNQCTIIIPLEKSSMSLKEK